MLRGHQLLWRELYRRTPEVEPIQNAEVIDATLGTMVVHWILPATIGN